MPNHSIHPNEFFDFCLNIIAGNCQKYLHRHSRAGGNLDLRTTAIFKDYLKVRDSRFPLSRE
ncbi:hypothetical protein A6J50_12565 [Neisseria meningitidis]|nr:hypothetical protein A6J54_09985 [Neisseria meningitidis]ARC11264.1 hypothetical protein A6J50_12565 [Neisseria meningitidis]